MEDMFKLGPRNMRGEIWDEKGHSELVEILISHQQDVINSIRFTYYKNDKVSHSQTYGEPYGSNFDMVQFGVADYALTSVSGELMNGKLVSIVFGTNKKKYGPFGRTASSRSISNSSCEDFKYEFKVGRFGGFHGSVYNGSVYAIGVYVKPCRVFTIDAEELLEEWMDQERDAPIIYMC